MTDCRQKVCEELGLQEDAVELSMGMSNDFEEAVSGLAAAFAMQQVVGGKAAGARQSCNGLCFGLSVFSGDKWLRCSLCSIQWCPILFFRTRITLQSWWYCCCPLGSLVLHSAALHRPCS